MSLSSLTKVSPTPVFHVSRQITCTLLVPSLLLPPTPRRGSFYHFPGFCSDSRLSPQNWRFGTSYLWWEDHVFLGLPFFWSLLVSVYIHHIFIIHSYVGGCVGFFHFLAIVSRVAMNMTEYQWNIMSSPLGICQRVVEMGRMVGFFFPFENFLHWFPEWLN